MYPTRYITTTVVIDDVAHTTYILSVREAKTYSATTMAGQINDVALISVLFFIVPHYTTIKWWYDLIFQFFHVAPALFV